MSRKAAEKDHWRIWEQVRSFSKGFSPYVGDRLRQQIGPGSSSKQALSFDSTELSYDPELCNMFIRIPDCSKIDSGCKNIKG